ncbi:MAG TPA: monooxygenase [Mycobacteriales bacterium]|nr:monooxygenase [Mycobacteriales bacterium]
MPSDVPDVPGLVTLHLWRVPGRGVPGAVARMATHRAALRRTAGLTFAKLLGTGRGRTFSVRDADPYRWGLLACWSSPAHARAFEDGPVTRSWRRAADEEWRVDLAPLSARGRWSGRTPFGEPAAGWDGPVAALTRARIAPRRAAAFWRAVPPVAADLHGHDGLLAALGVGEAPVGLTGTFSVWRSARHLERFAYRSAAHARVIRRTAEERWYAEELFARFGVLRSVGSYGGRDPVA